MKIEKSGTTQTSVIVDKVPVPEITVENSFAGMNKSYHHHHHRLDIRTWALAFLRSVCQLKYPAVASSGFVTRVFSRVGLSAPRPTPGSLGGPMFPVRVVSLS
jgi:hypothetical protein